MRIRMDESLITSKIRAKNRIHLSKLTVTLPKYKNPSFAGILGAFCRKIYSQKVADKVDERTPALDAMTTVSAGDKRISCQSRKSWKIRNWRWKLELRLVLSMTTTIFGNVGFSQFKLRNVHVLDTL